MRVREREGKNLFKIFLLIIIINNIFVHEYILPTYFSLIHHRNTISCVLNYYYIYVYYNNANINSNIKFCIFIMIIIILIII